MKTALSVIIMTYNKRKKNSRQRGSKTHGYGSKKKHRGRGNRGGTGKAGTGKRADQKKPNIWKQEYFGKHGFKPPRQRKQKGINIKFFEERFEKLLAKGIIKEVDAKFKLKLSDLKAQKLLSKGKPTRPYIIECDSSTKKAIEKIKSAGGEVLLRNTRVDEGEGKNKVKVEEVNVEEE